MKARDDRIETDDFVVVATQASATVLLLIRNKDRPDYRSAFLSPEQARKIAALLNSNADAADATLTPEARAAEFDKLAAFMREHGSTEEEIMARHAEIFSDSPDVVTRLLA